MIDLHTHLLPGIDDGPPDVEGSIALARAAAASGTTTIAATPHIDRSFGVDPFMVRDAVAALAERLKAERLPIEVVAGGEVALDRAGDLDDDALAAVRLGSGRHLLVECPLTVHAGPLETQVGALRLRGFEILLAHPERSPALQRNPERVGALVQAGALCSVTASSFSGRFGREARTLVRSMLRDGLVHSIDSDAHDVERRPPGLGHALADAGLTGEDGAAMAEWLTAEVPAAILAGEALPPRPATPRGPKRSLLDRLRRAS